MTRLLKQHLLESDMYTVPSKSQNLCVHLTICAHLSRMAKQMQRQFGFTVRTNVIMVTSHLHTVEPRLSEPQLTGCSDYPDSKVA